MRQHICEIFAYIDDFIIVSDANDANHHYQALFHLFSDLGLPINQEKLSPPTRVLTCLGIIINLDNDLLYIEKCKMEEIYAECLSVKSKNFLTRHQFESCLVKLIYLHKCIKPARIFVSRILFVFRNSSQAKKIKLIQEFFMDAQGLLTSAWDRVFKAYRPSTDQLIMELILQHTCQFYCFIHFLLTCHQKNHISAKVIRNYFSSISSLSQFYDLWTHGLSYTAVLRFLRGLSIKFTFTPTPRGVFDIRMKYDISKACDSLHDSIL